MIVDIISDLHGYLPLLGGGDILLICGDLTASDKPNQYFRFMDWAKGQDYRKICIIAGNHDGLVEKREWVNFGYTDSKKSIVYLQDEYTDFEGLNIYGSPWTPEFCNWSFMAGPEQRKELCSYIPLNTDILMTHGPSWGILDLCDDMDGKPFNAGCYHLRKRVEEVKPTIHCFGHIHEGYGQMILKHEGPNTICVNASIMTREYKPINKPIRIIL